MIDVRLVATCGLWILGAAAALAALSYHRWLTRAEEGRSQQRRLEPHRARFAVARLAAAEPLIILAIAPALLLPTPARLCVALCIPVIWWCNWRVSGRLIPSTPINLCLFLLLAMTMVSLGATFDVRVSLDKVSGVLLGVVVFWAMTRWTNSRPRLALAATGFLVTGAALAMLGLLGTNWFGKFSVLTPIIDRLPRAIHGLPGAEEGFQPNAVAGCLVLFIPLQVTLLAAKGRDWLISIWPGAPRRLAGIAQLALLALTAGTLLLTQSRGAWVGMLVASLVFLGWHSRLTRAIGVAVLIGLAGLALATGPRRLMDMAISQSGPEMAHNVSGRMELWSRAIDGIRDFPFTGMGMNVFRKVQPRMYPMSTTAPGFDVAHAHNHLLQAALDLGIPGLVGYLGMWLTVAMLLVRVYRRSVDPIGRYLAGGLGAGLIAHFTFSLTDAIPLGAKVGVLFWVTIALAVSVHQVLVPPPVSPDRAL